MNRAERLQLTEIVVRLKSAARTLPPHTYAKPRIADEIERLDRMATKPPGWWERLWKR